MLLASVWDVPLNLLLPCSPRVLSAIQQLCNPARLCGAPADLGPTPRPSQPPPCSPQPPLPPRSTARTPCATRLVCACRPSHITRASHPRCLPAVPPGCCVQADGGTGHSRGHRHDDCGGRLQLLQHQPPAGGAFHSQSGRRRGVGAGLGMRWGGRLQHLTLTPTPLSAPPRPCPPCLLPFCRRLAR